MTRARAARKEAPEVSSEDAAPSVEETPVSEPEPATSEPEVAAAAAPESDAETLEDDASEPEQGSGVEVTTAAGPEDIAAFAAAAAEARAEAEPAADLTDIDELKKHFPEVHAEPAFGALDEDLGDSPDDTPAPAGGEQVSDPITATYVGLRGEDRFHPGTITVIVPNPAEGYEAMVTSGRTYTLHLNKPATVDAAHAEWLAGHPAYNIAIQ